MAVLKKGPFLLRRLDSEDSSSLSKKASATGLAVSTIICQLGCLCEIWRQLLPMIYLKAAKERTVYDNVRRQAAELENEVNSSPALLRSHHHNVVFFFSEGFQLCLPLFECKRGLHFRLGSYELCEVLNHFLLPFFPQQIYYNLCFIVVFTYYYDWPFFQVMLD
jgi:hypothetical protein